MRKLTINTLILILGLAGVLLAGGYSGGSTSSWNLMGGSLNVDSGQSASSPSIAMDAPGNPVVAWYENNASGKNQVYVKRWNSGTSSWDLMGGSLNVNSGKTANSPSIAMDASGNPIVSWYEFNASSLLQVYVKRWNSGTSSWDLMGGSLNVDSGKNASKPSIATDSLGNPIVSWYEYNASSLLQVYVKRWNSGTSSWDLMGGSLNVDSGKNANKPSIATDASGNPIVSWCEYNASYKNQVYVKRWNSGTSSWDLIGESLNVDSDQGALSPSIAMDASGNPIVSWYEKNASSVYQVYVKRWNSGTSSWDLMGGSLNLNAGKTAQFPAVAIDASGNPIVSWFEYNASEIYQIYVKRWNSGTSSWNLMGESLNVDAGKDAQAPAVAIDASDNPIVSWFEKNASDKTQIYVKSYSTGGTVTFYVDSTKADDTGAGTSWETAKKTLQAALDLATSGDQIWVKAGTYFPTSAYDLTNTSRYYHFRMKNGVAIYGGFAGTESVVSERDNYGMGEANETILSGDFNQDDVVTDAGDTLSFSNNSENCYHVFYHPDSLGLDTTAVLDGFTLKGGNSDGASPHEAGAGMYNDSNSPLLNSVNIIYNYASFSGGGMFNQSSSPVITNSNVLWNKSIYNGGGIHFLNAAPFLTNVLIACNYSFSSGGGIYNTSLQTNTTLTNVTITNNTTKGSGGGVVHMLGASGTYNNCIIYGNTGTRGSQFCLHNNGAHPVVTLNYSCYGNASGDVENFAYTFTTTNNNITSNPLIVDAAGGDYRIYNISPCADAGNDVYNSETTDIRGAGFSRKLEKTTSNAGTIDMGAYEYKYGTDPVAPPEIDVQGNYVSIVNGDDSPSLTDHTDFDSVNVSYGTQQRTYTIHNTGAGTLYLGPQGEKNAATSSIETPSDFVTISGDHSDDFTVTTQPASSVAAGDSTTFVVEFDPSAIGTRSATVNMTNNDSDENPFSFDIQGLGTTPEIDVRGNYLSIADGDTTPSADDSTSFGSAAVDGGTINRTYKIFNTGNERLYFVTPAKSELTMNHSTSNQLTPKIIRIGGDHRDDFTVTLNPENHIDPSDSTSFTIQFNPSAGGTRSATVEFPNNDIDEDPYSYAIEGVGITPPTVTTATFDSITVISAVGGGNVTADGGDSVTVRGVCWGLAENPTVDSSHTSDGQGTGEFSSSITGLAHGTTYHVRAYATNSAGTGYGADSTFTTEQIIVSITPADTLLKGGQQVTYTVSIANVLPAMRGYTMHVGYNGEHFSEATITEGSYLSSVGTTQWDAAGSDGSYDIDCAILGATDGQTGDGTLFTVQLTTASSVTDSLVNPESANLTISSITMRDVVNDPIVCDQSNGSTIVIDTAPPTLETIAEDDSVWYRSGPTLSNFGFDDNYALEAVGYKINDGEWDVVTDDITGTEYNNDGISLPTYSSLVERTTVHTIYFYAVDDAMNTAGYDDDSWHFSFYKDETAPDGELAITFTEVGVRSMNVVSAAFEDATQGEVYYQFDCTSQDYYDRARTLADSVHECYEMNANTEYKFKYQVSDGVADPNETPAYNATAWSTEYSKYTLSVAPTTSTVTCDKSGTISTTTLTFYAVGGFGAGKVEYYRYALSDSATHTWTDSETKWSTGNLMLGIPTANTNYYLHVKGFNAEDVANGTLALGPYQWDGTPISPVTELSFEATGEDNNSSDMSWTNPEHDAHYIEVWVKGFGGYPQYTGSKPEFPTTPTEASEGGWTQLMDTLATAYTYTPSNRDFYYCAVFVEDLAEHYSAAAIDSSLSYWLGDVNATPDGLVNSADIAILASAYRTESGDNDYNAVCDVGPTTNYGRTSRPVPDQSISFEDLMVFAMNYENTGSHKLKKSGETNEANPIALKMHIQKVGTQFVAQIQLENNNAFVKAMEIPVAFGADLAISSVRKGALVTSSDFFDSSQEGQTVYISAASLDNIGGFDGDGVVAEIVFKVSGTNTAIQFADATARTKTNDAIEVSYDYTDVALLSEGLIPTEYKLHQNYPNPFNPSTTILYDLKADGQVTMTLYNINGQRIATLLDEVKNAGYHSFVFDAGNLPSGMYIYQIEVNDFRDVRKLVLMK
ncbi:MAG: choice-of-anchor D domain-containing protein [Candidatus Zhuqueibacterota bacterium]